MEELLNLLEQEDETKVLTVSELKRLISQAILDKEERERRNLRAEGGF